MEICNIGSSSGEKYLISHSLQREKNNTKFHLIKVIDDKNDFNIARLYNDLININYKEIDNLKEEIIQSNKRQKDIENVIKQKMDKIEILINTEKELGKQAYERKEIYYGELEKYNCTEMKFIKLGEEHNKSIEKYEFVRSIVSNLNSKIELKKGKSKNLTLQLEKIDNEYEKIKDKIKVIKSQIKLNVEDHRSKVNPIKKEIKTYERNILTKIKEKKLLKNLLQYKIKNSPEIIAEERRLRKEIRIAEKPF